jgi:methylthioribose-1-phosphate isomerase
MLQAIKYNKGDLEILDQLQLPFVQKYIPIQTAEDGWHAIKDMKVRGAPAIAIVAMLALASELTSAIKSDQLSKLPEDVCHFIREKLAYLVTSRPTAVNLSDAAGKLEIVVTNCVKVTGSHGHDVAAAFIQAAEDMLGKDLEDNQSIGHNGAEWIVANAIKPGNSGLAVLTHCNTG